MCTSGVSLHHFEPIFSCITHSVLHQWLHRKGEIWIMHIKSVLLTCSYMIYATLGFIETCHCSFLFFSHWLSASTLVKQGLHQNSIDLGILIGRISQMLLPFLTHTISNKCQSVDFENWPLPTDTDATRIWSYGCSDNADLLPNLETRYGQTTWK